MAIDITLLRYDFSRINTAERYIYNYYQLR